MCHVIDILKLLKKHGMKISTKKCVWFAGKVFLLGYVIGEDKVRIDPKKVETIKNRQPPKTKKDVLRFLGLANYYSDFIPEYSKRIKPIQNLTHNDVKFLMDPRMSRGFQIRYKLSHKRPMLSSTKF